MPPPDLSAPDKRYTYPLRVAALASRKPTRLHLVPDAKSRALIAAEIGAREVTDLEFHPEIRASGAHDWCLEGKLRATVVQNCVITLAPVTTTISETVTRRYLAGLEDTAAGDEAEIPEDTSIEPLTGEIDVGAVMIEALVLALPDYPRAAGSALGEAVFAEPGKKPMRDEQARPFAGLAKLRDKLGN